MIRKTKGLLGICTIFAAMVFMLLIAQGSVGADTDELNQIRHEINAKGAKWHADETSVSRLSENEKKKRLGNDDMDLAAIVGATSEQAPVAAVEGVPTSLDWRNNGGTVCVSPVKNQGSCGSCWAFAVTAALESQEMIGTGGTLVDLSEQTLVSCSGSGTCSGGSPTSASTYIQSVGLPLEACFPYTATNNSCSNACANWQASTYKVNGFRTASASGTPSTKVQEIKNALYTYGPVLATFYVFNDFYSYRSGVYSYVTGSYLGAHAVLIVGYDDAYQAFIVKNSWGTGWGMSGYFMIAYSEVGGTSNFAYSNLAYDGYGSNPTPPPPTPDCTYTLSAAGKTFKAAGGTGRFTVTTQSGCHWSASDPAVTWVGITSDASGTMSGTVTYAVDPNTGAARSTTISVEGQIYKITQQAIKNR